VLPNDNNIKQIYLLFALQLRKLYAKLLAYVFISLRLGSRLSHQN